MTGLIKRLHDTAMNLHDLGKIAKVKGDLDTYEFNKEMSYLFEREAALRYFALKEDTLWRYTLLRSAGWMALDVNDYEDAKRLAELGISDGAEGYLKQELEEVIAAANKKQIDLKQSKDKDGLKKILGTLTGVNVDSQVINIRYGKKREYQAVVVDTDEMENVLLHIGKPVRILIQEKEFGLPVLQDIQRAA